MKKGVIFDWWNTLRKPNYEGVIEQDVQKLIKKIYKSKIKLGVISNTDDEHTGAYIRKKLKELDLLHYFEFIISSGSIGIHKPDKRIFEYGINLFACKPEEILMVGDSVTCDGGCQLLGIEYFYVNSENEIWGNKLEKYLFPHIL